MDKTFSQFQEHYLSKTLKLHWNSRQGKQKKNFRSSFRSSGLFLRITRHKVTCIKGQRNYRGLKAFLACVTVKLTSYPQLV